MEKPADELSDAAGTIIYMVTDEAYLFKHLLEFAWKALTTLVIKIYHDRFELHSDNSKTPNGDETLMIKLKFGKQEFLRWHIPSAISEDPEAVLLLAVSAAPLRTVTRDILKKDVMTMIIEDDDPLTLHITLDNPGKERHIETEIKLLDPKVVPEHRLNPAEAAQYIVTQPRATATMTEFMKALAAGRNVKAETIKFVAQEKGIKIIIESPSGDQPTRSWTFGQWKRRGKEVYSESFLTKNNIEAIAKCAAMGKKVRVYCEERKALLISITAGEMGELNAYFVPYKEAGVN